MIVIFCDLCEEIDLPHREYAVGQGRLLHYLKPALITRNVGAA
jgi:hypothetical protein